VERCTHFNKRETRNTKSPTKPRLLTIQIHRQQSQRGVVLQSVTQRARSFCADSIDYRSKYEFRNTVPMGDAANRQSQQQSQQAHSIYGSIDRASPQSTLNSPTSVTHTSTKETRKHKITNETKTTHVAIPPTMKSAWCCPSERHPTPSLLYRRFYSLYMIHPSGEIQIRIQKNSSNGRRCQQAIATSALDTWWYGSWFSKIHFENSPTSRAFHTLQQKETHNHQSPTKPTLLTI
jgi:hypothetical protein